TSQILWMVPGTARLRSIRSRRPPRKVMAAGAAPQVGASRDGVCSWRSRWPSTGAPAEPARVPRASENASGPWRWTRKLSDPQACELAIVVEGLDLELVYPCGALPLDRDLGAFTPLAVAG